MTKQAKQVLFQDWVTVKVTPPVAGEALQAIQAKADWIVCDGINELAIGIQAWLNGASCELAIQTAVSAEGPWEDVGLYSTAAPGPSYNEILHLTRQETGTSRFGRCVRWAFRVDTAAVNPTVCFKLTATGL